MVCIEIPTGKFWQPDLFRIMHGVQDRSLMWKGIETVEIMVFCINSGEGSL